MFEKRRLYGQVLSGAVGSRVRPLGRALMILSLVMWGVLFFDLDAQETHTAQLEIRIPHNAKLEGQKVKVTLLREGKRVAQTEVQVPARRFEDFASPFLRPSFRQLRRSTGGRANADHPF